MASQRALMLVQGPNDLCLLPLLNLECSGKGLGEYVIYLVIILQKINLNNDMVLRPCGIFCEPYEL